MKHGHTEELQLYSSSVIHMQCAAAGVSVYFVVQSTLCSDQTLILILNPLTNLTLPSELFSSRIILVNPEYNVL